MTRYKVPRIIFVNKLDRQGANPFKAIDMVRNRLGMKVAAVQIPIGLDSELRGLVDLIEMQAYQFDGPNGEIITKIDIPEHLIGTPLFYISRTS